MCLSSHFELILELFYSIINLAYKRKREYIKVEVVVGKLAGFCPGVENTIKRAREILKNNDNVYCLGEIVHNTNVVNNLKKSGIEFINDIIFPIVYHPCALTEAFSFFLP